jgi:hypothetical protein
MFHHQQSYQPLLPVTHRKSGAKVGCRCAHSKEAAQTHVNSNKQSIAQQIIATAPFFGPWAADTHVSLSAAAQS